MNKQFEILEGLFIKHHTKELEWNKSCETCGDFVTVVAIVADDGALTIEGGAIYFAPENTKEENKVLIKCEKCAGIEDAQIEEKPKFNYQETEVYSRVCGYLRPIRQWNKGKQAEFEMRENYKIKEEV